MEIFLVIGASIVLCLVIAAGMHATYELGRRRCSLDWCEYGKTLDREGREIILEGAKFVRELRVERGEEL